MIDVSSLFKQALCMKEGFVIINVFYLVKKAPRGGVCQIFVSNLVSQAPGGGDLS